MGGHKQNNALLLAEVRTSKGRNFKGGDKLDDESI